MIFAFGFLESKQNDHSKASAGGEDELLLAKLKVPKRSQGKSQMICSKRSVLLKEFAEPLKNHFAPKPPTAAGWPQGLS